MKTLYDLLTFCMPSSAPFAKVPALGSVRLYTAPVPTPCYTSLVTQLAMWTRPYDSNVELTAYPQISNDAQNWKELTGSDAFGPLTGPTLALKRQTEVGCWQRFSLSLENTGMADAAGGVNLAISSVARGGLPESAPGSGIEEMAAYLDKVRRGFTGVSAPGDARLMPLWSGGAVLTSDDGLGTEQAIYSPMFPVHEYPNAVIQLVVQSFHGNDTATLDVTPVTTVAGIPGQFTELTSCAFTSVVKATELPFVQTVLAGPLGTQLGVKIAFHDPGQAGQPMGANLSVLAVGDP